MVCLLAVFAAACSPVQEISIPDGQSAAIKGTPATVTYVVDGDTLDVKFKNGKTERVRMLLVDTPETKHPRLGVQPFGPESSKFTKTQLTGKKVGVELDISERDKYGRLLAYIWIGKQNFNQLLLEKGLARVAYVYPPNTKYVDQFRATQEKAQQKALASGPSRTMPRRTVFMKIPRAHLLMKTNSLPIPLQMRNPKENAT